MTNPNIIKDTNRVGPYASYIFFRNVFASTNGKTNR